MLIRLIGIALLLLAAQTSRGAGSEIVGFALINADTDQPLAGYDPIGHGAQINLATLPTRNLSVVAQTFPVAMGSVRFEFDADADFNTENDPPYSLAGDGDCDHRPWTPTVGMHQISATPYSLADGLGTAGTPRLVSFRVVDDAAVGLHHPPVANAGPDQFATPPARAISLRGNGTVVDGRVVRYVWTQRSGPSLALGEVVNQTLNLPDLAHGYYVFRLVVTDDHGMTGVDEAAVSVRTVANRQGIVSGELKKWHALTVTFDGPDTFEAATPNPFLDYRMNVTFLHAGQPFVVPGYYAADGQAADSGATGGNKWRVRFTPNAEGLWTYTASFRTGPNLEVNPDPEAGTPLAFDGGAGYFRIGATDKTGRDHRAKGMLHYVDRHHLRFDETGEYFLKGGTNSPENFLGYSEFDGSQDGCQLGHLYAPHVQDWRSGDPTWSGGRGKGIIGALNYLAGVGGNSVYFITYNLDGGDGEDTWPWRTPLDRDRFDCSKLDQWEVVFSHMDRLGLQLHVLTQENENEGVLDGGNLGVLRKLYYRQLVARFGHHLALQWNIGEENVQSDARRIELAQYIRSVDPYNHPIAMHTLYNAVDSAYDGLVGDPSFEATSIQGDSVNYNAWAITMRQRSRERERDWVVYGDEQGPAVDRELTLLDTLRRDALWGNLMGGGAGVEWYFGYQGDFGDLTSEDWRVLEPLWRQTRYALDFFQTHVPFWDMEPANELASAPGDARVLALPDRTYVVYLPTGGSGMLDVGAVQTLFSVQWYRPRQGGSLAFGTVRYVHGPGVVSIGSPPRDTGDDWAALVRRLEPPGPTGDINGDGLTNMADLAPFIRAILSPATAPPAHLAAADMNSDGRLDGRDIAGWVEAVR